MTFGLEAHVECLNVANRRSKSPRSHGLHDDWKKSAAAPSALVLSAGWEAGGATWDDPALETWSLPNQSMLATIACAGGDEAPAELQRKGEKEL